MCVSLIFWCQSRHLNARHINARHITAYLGVVAVVLVVADTLLLTAWMRTMPCFLLSDQVPSRLSRRRLVPLANRVVCASVKCVSSVQLYVDGVTRACTICMRSLLLQDMILGEASLVGELPISGDHVHDDVTLSEDDVTGDGFLSEDEVVTDHPSANTHDGVDPDDTDAAVGASAGNLAKVNIE